MTGPVVLVPMAMAPLPQMPPAGSLVECRVLMLAANSSTEHSPQVSTTGCGAASKSSGRLTAISYDKYMEAHPADFGDSGDEAGAGHADSHYSEESADEGMVAQDAMDAHNGMLPQPAVDIPPVPTGAPARRRRGNRARARKGALLAGMPDGLRGPREEPREEDVGIMRGGTPPMDGLESEADSHEGGDIEAAPLPPAVVDMLTDGPFLAVGYTRNGLAYLKCGPDCGGACMWNLGRRKECDRGDDCQWCHGAVHTVNQDKRLRRLLGQA
mmetsp:Transcript_29890/g.80963  ORF Transcript_29890/g.80963 Transcript_29890/m.80963 type:complete len:270 (-) Transcript_29890:112-921(-)